MRRATLVVILLALITLGATPAKAQSFITECGPSHRAQVDPIVTPNGVSAHFHEFFGNTTTNASSTYATMIGQATTCDVAGDTAGYWAPTLLNSAGQVIPARRMTVYYRDRPQESRTVTPFPPDFRMIAGAPQPGISGWNCDGLALSTTVRIDCSGQTSGHTFVRGTIIFPNCGQLNAAGNVITDSPDHRSHVAYPISARRGCPATHPVQLPHLKVNIRYAVSNCIAAGCRISSDPGASCTVPGCSLHSDFWNTWDQTALVNMVNTQLNS